MASLLLPIANSTAAGSSSRVSFSRAFMVRNRDHRFGHSIVSCSSTNGGDSNSEYSISNIRETSVGKLDRRNVLLGIGGLYGATATDKFAFGAPVPAPEPINCGATDAPRDVTFGNCCPPPATKIIDFKLPSPDSPIRIRQAAHLASEEDRAKYRKAVELMKALPDDDPRSFKQQANIHYSYCNGASDQLGFDDLEVQVHNSWLSFPFHRYYLYFYERILGKLIEDPTFALPFWSWDTSPGMEMQAMYAELRSDSKRNTDPFPPTVIDLNYDFTKSTSPDPEIVAQKNLSIMYRQVVSGAKSAKLFFGSAYRAGDQHEPGSVQIWSALGNLYAAQRDPLFFGHHANVDRMWTIWKTIGGRKRKDLTDPEWLDSAFLFYDENAQLVRVKVRDCLDPLKLRYTYQEIPIPWLKSRPQPKVKMTGKIPKSGVAQAAEPPRTTTTITIGDFPKPLESTIIVEVPRPKKSRSLKEKEDEEEVLLITGIELDIDAFVKFDVFIDDEDYAASRPDNTEFAGSFVNVPHGSTQGTKKKTSLRIPMNELLEDLEAEDDDSIMVTIVPRAGTVTVGGVGIDYVSA